MVQYEWYPDLFLIEVFLVDLAAFLAGLLILKKRIKIGICMFAALISAAMETVLFLVMCHYLIYRMTVLFLIDPMLVVFLMRPGKISDFFCSYLTVSGVILFMGGVQSFFFQIIPSSQGKLFWCLLLAAVSACICCIEQKRKRGRRNVYEAKLVYEGEIVTLRALMDTGNLLRDPFTGKPVHVVSGEAVQPAFKMSEEKIRYVPYHTVGMEQGLMKVLTIDKMYLILAGREVEIPGPVIGIADRKVFSNDRIQMVLNGSVLDGRQ